MKKSIIAFVSFILCSFFSQALFAEIKLLSPIPGTWANKQVLLIDNTEDGEYFYSLNGSDPDKFGFAYDGPVILNTNGDITLKVSFVPRHGKKETVTVNYSVIENDAFTLPYQNFISSFFDTGILNYSSGSYISIPANLSYSFGLPPDSFTQGQELVLSEKSILTRSIPCVIWDKETNTKWRFIIKTYPQSAGTYSRRDVPFTITDWETITFTDDSLLYKIDSEFWELPKKPKTIDRSVSHMISWQSLSYEAGNPVEFFVLPPKPEILSKTEEDGALIYYVSGDDSYSMSVLTGQESDYQELFTELGVDAFAGDRVSGKLKLGIFASSVYQGELEASYKIDKRPPACPLISSNNEHFYSRENINALIKGEPDTELYVAISEPLLLTTSDIIYDENDLQFKTVEANDFKLVTTSGQYNVNLDANGEGAVYYKIRAYSQSGENKSQIAQYSVIIDQYNYYFDSSSDAKLENGTIQYPFKDFTACLEEINKSRSVCLRVKGTITIPKGKNMLLANCTFVNESNGVIAFEGDSSLIVKNAGIELNNFRIINTKGKSSSIIPLFKLENSVLTMNSCEAGIEFIKNGTFIDAFKSVLNVADSIISVGSVSYVSFASAVNSRVSVKSSTINCNADTSVILSSNGGELKLVNNSMKVTGKTGRISELFGAEALFEKNTFNAQLSKKGNVSAVYSDKAAVVTLKNNNQYGF